MWMQKPTDFYHFTKGVKIYIVRPLQNVHAKTTFVMLLQAFCGLLISAFSKVAELILSNSPCVMGQIFFIEVRSWLLSGHTPFPQNPGRFPWNHSWVPAVLYRVIHNYRYKTFSPFLAYLEAIF